MARFLPVTNEGAGHPLRRSLPPPEHPVVRSRKGPGEDIAFFLVSFASSFIILYGFVV